LHAVALFDQGNFDDAINTFIELDINPAKVVALYPDSIAGRLSTPREKWFELHGGQPPPDFVQIEPSGATSSHESSNVTAETPEQTGGSPGHVAQGSFRGKWMAGFDRLVPSGGSQKDDDTVSLSGKGKDKPAGRQSL
jgi:Vam6/Vps39-like protein vacuolar protein sorting-associated protein 39